MHNATLNQIVHGNQGPEGDVWAAAITAIEMLCCGRRDKKPYELRDVNNIFEFAACRLTALDGGGAPPTPTGKNYNPMERRPTLWCQYDEVCGRRVAKPDNVHPLHTGPEHVEQLLFCITYLWGSDDDDDEEFVESETDDGAGRAPTYNVVALVALLRSMLQMWRHDRITMRQAANHSFFQTHQIGHFAPPNPNPNPNQIGHFAPPRATTATLPLSPVPRTPARSSDEDGHLLQVDYESPPDVVCAPEDIASAESPAAPSAVTSINRNVRLLIDLAKFLSQQETPETPQNGDTASPPGSPSRTPQGLPEPLQPLPSPRASFIDSLQAAFCEHVERTRDLNLTLDQLRSVLAGAMLPPKIAQLPAEDLFGAT